MPCIKVVFLGASVGKTSALKRIIGAQYNFEYYDSTIGSNVDIKTIISESEKIITLQIWDTAGQQRFQSLISAYVKHAEIIVLFCDLSQPLDPQIGCYKSQIGSNIGTLKDIKLILVGTKADLVGGLEDQWKDDGDASARLEAVKLVVQGDQTLSRITDVANMTSCIFNARTGEVIEGVEESVDTDCLIDLLEQTALQCQGVVVQSHGQRRSSSGFSLKRSVMLLGFCWDTLRREGRDIFCDDNDESIWWSKRFFVNFCGMPFCSDLPRWKKRLRLFVYIVFAGFFVIPLINLIKIPTELLCGFIERLYRRALRAFGRRYDQMSHFARGVCGVALGVYGLVVLPLRILSLCVFRPLLSPRKSFERACAFGEERVGGKWGKIVFGGASVVASTALIGGLVFVFAMPVVIVAAPVVAAVKLFSVLSFAPVAVAAPVAVTAFANSTKEIFAVLTQNPKTSSVRPTESYSDEEEDKHSQDSSQKDKKLSGWGKVGKMFGVHCFFSGRAKAEAKAKRTQSMDRAPELVS